MRRIALLLIIMVVLMMLSGCGNKPDSVAKQFLNAIQNKDFGTAKTLATKDSQDMLSLLQGYSDKLSEEQKAEMGDTKFTITDTQVTGDSAIVTYEQYNTQEPDRKDTRDLKLVKEEGKWKVKLEKGNAGK